MQRIPGFSAEASLYKTSKRYRMVATTLSTLAGEHGVLPQAGGGLVCAGDPDNACYVWCGVEDPSTGTSYTLGRYRIADCYQV